MGFEKDQAPGETGGGAGRGADALAWGTKGMATADAPGGVAAEAGVAMGSVNHHYGTMQVLRDAVMQRAVEEEQLELIAQGIAMGDNIAKSAPLELRQRALTTLL